MPLLNCSLSTLQRRAMQQLGGAVAFTAAINLIIRPVLPQPHSSPLWATGLSLLYVLPVLFAIVVIARYLRSEPDEFVRALMTRSLLWGIGVTMATDAIVGVLFDLYGQTIPLALLNADIFFISTFLAFRLLQRSYR